jgi:hypothetical protein
VLEQAVSSSGYWCEYMSWLFLGQNRSVMLWTASLCVRRGVRGFGQDFSRSGYGCECKG